MIHNYLDRMGFLSFEQFKKGKQKKEMTGVYWIILINYDICIKDSEQYNF